MAGAGVRSPARGRPVPLLLLLAWALQGGCGAGAADPPAAPARLGALEAEVFATSCSLSASCHAGSAPKEGLDLTAPVWAKIVNQPSAQLPDRKLVVPGQPDASYLYEKVARAMPTVGVRMPNTSPPLPEATLAALRAWIAGGAKND